MQTHKAIDEKKEIEDESPSLRSHNTFMWQEYPLGKWKKFECMIRA